MQVQLRHDPSFTVARCVLAGNEQMRVEGGAMIAHSAGVSVSAMKPEMTTAKVSVTANCR